LKDTFEANIASILPTKAVGNWANPVRTVTKRVMHNQDTILFEKKMIARGRRINKRTVSRFPKVKLYPFLLKWSPANKGIASRIAKSIFLKGNKPQNLPH
jgi:hypothetical protein